MGAAFGQATITYSAGIMNTSDASGPSWVNGSSMYKKIDNGNSVGVTNNGFSSVADASKLTWTLADLDLSIADSISPGVASAGLEVYKDNDDSSNLRFYYNGAEWINGLIKEYKVSVDNNADISATGEGYAIISGHTVAGTAFYNEIMSLTGGTGRINFVATSFAAVAAGQFTSAGYISAVPEPGTTALFFGLGVLGFIAWRRRR